MFHSRPRVPTKKESQKWARKPIPENLIVTPKQQTYAVMKGGQANLDADQMRKFVEALDCAQAMAEWKANQIVSLQEG